MTGVITGQQRKIIRTLKGLNTDNNGAGHDVELSVLNDAATKVGSLRPLSQRLANDEELVDKLAAWRRRFGRFFFTQFEVTAVGTRVWLNDAIVKDDSRILFLIADATNRLIGHLGACGIGEDTAEFDNFIRGERGGDPRVMLLSAVRMIGWMYAALHIRNFYGRVLADNYRTLAVYEAIGCFEQSSPRELLKAPDEPPTAGARKYVTMTLDTRKFLSRYPWMCDPG